MIGSLSDFIQLQENELQKQQPEALLEVKVNENEIAPRPKRSITTYVPSDKAVFLKRFQKAKKPPVTKVIPRKPLQKDTCYFSSNKVIADEISQTELKRKHNLLRAIVRIKQSEDAPQGESHYVQSFQRLYAGYSSIHPHPMLKSFISNKYSEEDSPLPPLPLALSLRKPLPTLSRGNRILFQQCLHWAKKHQKNGEFFAEQLGKSQHSNKNRVQSKNNRTLIEEISKQFLQRTITDR